MDHRRSQNQPRNLILTALCVAAVAAAGCAASPRKTTEGAGGAGGTGAGGASASGGASGSGGQSGVSTGGSGNPAGGSSGGTSGGGSGGDADAAAGGSTGGAGGQGGSNGGAGGAVAPQPLTCKEDSDCPSGRNCKAGACVNPRGCSDSLECGSPDLVCDASRGFCVQCVRAADCPSGQSCLSNRCASPAGCQRGVDAGAGDCGPGKVCDPSGACVECSTHADCSPTERCIQNTCQTACDSDKDCTPKGMLCNLTVGVCTECSSQRPCASGSYCDGSGVCKFAVCLAGESRCVGNGIASCKADGTGFGTVTACSASQTCTVYGGVAECDDGAGAADAAASADGGASASDGGSTPVSGGPRTCGVPATAAPCTSLPNLVVTQTLDGRGDELCDIPAFHLNADTAKAAGKVIVQNATPPEDATVKVAWSSAGLAVLVEVADASVQSVNSVAANQAIDKVYQGDSIELFLASSNDVKGWPGSDSNTLHVTIPADGPAVVVKTSSTGITHSAWPASQYKQLKTATGYAIEAQLPWPTSAPGTGALVRFDIGLNSADKNFGGVDDMRDGQLIFYVGQVATSTCPSSDGTVPFCDDRTWCTTLLQ